MKFTLLTIHPHILDSYWKEGLLGKAIASEKVQLNAVNLRDFADPPHFRVDDKPYGGGPGMVLKPEPVVRALRKLAPEHFEPAKVRSRTRVVVLAAKGRAFSQTTAKRWAKNYDHLVFVCGRYEGIDERIRHHYADEEIRIGNYVLMGGEVAAAVIVEAVARLCPGVLGNPQSLADESFSAPKSLEYAQYTRPEDFEGHRVPEVLLQGNHAEIAKWRKR